MEQAEIDRRRANRMRAVDANPPEIRELINEYGYTVVRAFQDIGIEKPNHIRHLVETFLNELGDYPLDTRMI